MLAEPFDRVSDDEWRSSAQHLVWSFVKLVTLSCRWWPLAHRTVSMSGAPLEGLDRGRRALVLPWRNASRSGTVVPPPRAPEAGDAPAKASGLWK